MRILGFDPVILAGVWFAAAILMILLTACVVRLAAVPLLEAWTRARNAERERTASEALASRLGGIEAKLDDLARMVRESSENEPELGRAGSA